MLYSVVPAARLKKNTVPAARYTVPAARLKREHSAGGTLYSAGGTPYQRAQCLRHAILNSEVPAARSVRRVRTNYGQQHVRTPAAPCPLAVPEDVS